MPAIEGGPWATGIGSLPFTGADALDKALELAKRFVGEVPFEFELPRRFGDEALIRRPFAGLLEPGDMTEARLKGASLEALATTGRPNVSYAAFAGTLLTGKERWVKFQLAGPTVLGQFVLDRTGKPVAHTSEGRELVMAVLAKIVTSVCEAVRKDGTTTPIFFFDEPGLGRDVTDLARAVEMTRDAGAIVGVHDCGTDFRNALAARPDILSFDFASFGAHVGESWDPLGEFVKAGGALAWGAVSTAATARRFDPSVTAGAIRTAALRLTGSAQAARELLQRSLVTPACGTALLEAEHAVSLHTRAIQVAGLLRLAKT